MEGVGGILLAGGKSSRMGQEKGLLKVGDSFLYKRPLKVLETLCDNVIISTCEKGVFGEEHREICDEVPGIGPIGGIYTALKESDAEINIVISYDLPLVSAALFQELMRHTDDVAMVLPALKGGLAEPLCGIYRKSVASEIKNQIDAGEYAVNRLYKSLDTKILSIDERFPFFDQNMFLNVNRSEDFDKLLTLI